jgi:hypothetical protein
MAQFIKVLFQSIHDERIEHVKLFDSTDAKIWNMKLPLDQMDKYDYRTKGIPITPLGFALYCFSMENNRNGLIEIIDYIILNTPLDATSKNALGLTLVEEIDEYIEITQRYMTQFVITDEIDGCQVYVANGKYTRNELNRIIIKRCNAKIGNLQRIKSLIEKQPTIIRVLVPSPTPTPTPTPTPSPKNKTKFKTFFGPIRRLFTFVRNGCKSSVSA